MSLRAARKNASLIEQFDFIEVFNTCETPQANELASQLAEKHGKPGLGGSDSHKADYVGMGYTEFDEDITCNDDLIRAVRENRIVGAGGREREATPGMARKMHWTAVYGFMAYNVGLGYLFTPFRKFRKVQELTL